MPIKEEIQNAIKDAMRSKDSVRLECLRMAKGALLLKEKEFGNAIEDETAIAVLRTEVRKRQQSIDIFREHGKEEAATATEGEIAVLESFMPKQLSEADLEQRVRAYLAEHPDVTHAGKLTGALKKELGDLADGKLLNAACRKALG